MDIKSWDLLCRNNALLTNILCNNFKPSDIREVIRCNNEHLTRIEVENDEMAKASIKEYEQENNNRTYL
tara:strand:+ start:629 stop:835 length:207 start_codon:yes stop_codon:yes gene_type:complete